MAVISWASKETLSYITYTSSLRVVDIDVECETLLAVDTEPSESLVVQVASPVAVVTAELETIDCTGHASMDFPMTVTLS
jgi:hypothetical protein